MSNQSNLPTCFAHGRKAGEDIRNATRFGESGDARATLALHLAIEEDVEFVAFIPQKDDEPSERVVFRVLDLITNPEPKQEGGVKKDLPLIRARNQSICLNLFGLGEADNAFMSKFRRSLALAGFIQHMLADLPEAQRMAALSCIGLQTRKRVRHGESLSIAFLTVPTFMLFDPADKALKLNEQQQAQCKALAMFPVELDGSQYMGVKGVNQSLNYIRARADAVAGRGRNAGNTGERPARQLSASVAFLDALITETVKDDGQPVVAMNSKRRLELFLLGQRIAAMFAAEPLSESEQEELNKAASEKKAA